VFVPQLKLPCTKIAGTPEPCTTVCNLVIRTESHNATPGASRAVGWANVLECIPTPPGQ
jgi:hypothetical protein